MGLVSIEEAVLGFVRKVKDDPGLSELFRAALHELEVLLDPQLAQDESPAPGTGQAQAPAVEPSAVGAPAPPSSGPVDPSVPPVDTPVDPASAPVEPAQGG